MKKNFLEIIGISIIAMILILDVMIFDVVVEDQSWRMGATTLVLLSHAAIGGLSIVGLQKIMKSRL